MDIHQNRDKDTENLPIKMLPFPICRRLPERAMDMAGLKADDIDLIILATITPGTHCQQRS